MKLVEELKIDHENLLAVLTRIREIGKKDEEVIQLLQNVKTLLISHLKKEDAKLYPALKKAAEIDKKLRLMLDLFASDMEEVTETALVFFDKHAGALAVQNESNFHEDLDLLCIVLAKGIENEETKLYPEYLY